MPKRNFCMDKMFYPWDKIFLKFMTILKLSMDKVSYSPEGTVTPKQKFLKLVIL